MAVEEPIGFTEDGKLITCFRLTEADQADLYMAGELYAASPDGRAQYQRFMDSLGPGSIELSGYWET